MGYKIGMAAFNLTFSERVARTEYTDSWEIVKYFSGKDPQVDPTAWQGYNEAVHIDYCWTINDGPVPLAKRGRITDMGHAVYNEDGSDFREMTPSPFKSPEEVLAFNAVKEYGLLDYRGLVNYYEDWYRNAQGNQDIVISGGYYNTLVSGAIQIFGWDMLLEAMATDQQRFGEDVLGSIFDLSMHHYRAWAETSIEIFMCHDDMVWTSGPFANPDFYRKYIIPRYAELWKPLREAGKKVIYCSDGTFDMFADDLAAAGAHGFCFEPTNNLAMLVEKFGQSHVLMGGADCRTLTFGSKEEIEKELTEIFALTRDCPGMIFATGNHLPGNIPLENAIFYFELIERLGRR